MINNLDRYMTEAGANEELFSIIIVSTDSKLHYRYHHALNERTRDDKICLDKKWSFVDDFVAFHENGRILFGKFTNYIV